MPIKFYLSTSLAYISSSHHKPIKLSLETNNYTHNKNIQHFFIYCFIRQRMNIFFITTGYKS